MVTQADFTNLEQLRLSDHGDAIERFYWPRFSSELSEYEIFWKRFIVLLTNRVDPFALTDWIMVRDGLPVEYEIMLMANYSIFYHCVVAHEQIEIGQRAKDAHQFNHPELFFFSAKACLENLTVLQAKAGELRSGVKIRPRFPKSPGDDQQQLKKIRIQQRRDLDALTVAITAFESQYNSQMADERKRLSLLFIKNPADDDSSASASSDQPSPSGPQSGPGAGPLSSAIEEELKSVPKPLFTSRSVDHVQFVADLKSVQSSSPNIQTWQCRLES